MCRFTAGLGVGFFLMAANYDIKKLLQLCLPVVVSGLILLGYNFSRFGSIWNNGYANSQGFLFSYKYILTNSYNYFFKLKDLTKTPGASFFVVSPIFLYMFGADWKKRMVRMALLPIGIVLPLLLTYYYSGWFQIGPRYMLDLLPWAYLVLLEGFKNQKLTNFARGLILGSAIFNLYLFRLW